MADIAFYDTHAAYRHILTAYCYAFKQSDLLHPAMLPGEERTNRFGIYECLTASETNKA